MRKKPRVTPVAVRDLLLSQATNLNVIEMSSNNNGLNYPLFLLEELMTAYAVPSNFADPAIDLLIEKQNDLGFVRPMGWLDQATRFAAWASVDQRKKLVTPCIAQGSVLVAIWLLERLKAPIDREDIHCLARRVGTKVEADKLCALAKFARPDILETIKEECENSLNRASDIPF